ncbi:hypothetical protein AAVH_35311, partial [Aphelenchoides avenae]
VWINGLKASLTDEVVSHLGPFVQFHETGNQPPPALDICVEDSDIHVVDTRKPNPLRIRIGKLNVMDGPEKDGKS